MTKPIVTIKKIKPKREDDGVTHINVWSGGNTELGRALSHFNYAPFTHPYFGPFNCIEGFWQYITSQERPDCFRLLNGIKSKNKARALRKVNQLTRRHFDDFPKIIQDANYHKVLANPVIRKMLIESQLPFECYFVHGEGDVVIVPHGADWQCQIFEVIRRQFQNDEKPEVIDYRQFT